MKSSARVIQTLLYKKSGRSGFTLVELLLVMGLFSALAALSSINLVQPHTTTRMEIAASVLVSDIKQQQIRSMSSDTGGEVEPPLFGVHFTQGGYTLFSGIPYSQDAGSDFTVELDPILTFSTIDLPSSEIVFSRISGEVSGFDSEARNVILTDSVSGEQKIITVNSIGAVEIQ